MADAQANKSVYKRVRAGLSPVNNGTGAMDQKAFTPGGSYNRQSAGDATGGVAKYHRKKSGASAQQNANDPYQAKGRESIKPAVKPAGGKNATGKNAKFAD